MGLLSKAAAGASRLDESSRGGLLKLISQKRQVKTGNTALEKELMEMLYAGYAKYGIFQGVIIEEFEHSAGEFSKRLSLMVSGFGAAQGLVSGRALVLFSIKEDLELIGKHLAKTFQGNNIFSFQANTPQEAFSLIKPFLQMSA